MTKEHKDITLRDHMAIELDMSSVDFGSRANVAAYAGVPDPGTGVKDVVSVGFKAMAKARYEYADAMIAERNKGSSE